ncbi:MAG: hypothetical protein HDQ98_00325 [Lachnospiraceae bacterium]|nr:hypothetical protein [Lachnospiraceae bacterium]
MLDKKNRDHCKKSIWVIAVAGVVLVSALICVFVYYIGRNQPKQISSVTIMFSGVVEDTPIKFVSFELAEGFDNIDGKSIIQARTGADGTANFEVSEGEYTLRWHWERCYDGYQNVTVQGETDFLRKWLIWGRQNPDQPIEEPWAYILLEWQSEGNLDLCVYQEENGRCIGIEPTMDADGSSLYRDDNGDQGYELVYLKDAAVGNYRIYVKDCDSILNDCESRMEAEGVSVSIYTAQGAVYQKSAEAGESAGLWECASLCGGEVSEQDRYLYDLTDYAWVLRDGDDPASWLEGAYIKEQEVYKYPGNGSKYDSVERMFYDADGNMLTDIFYCADGTPDYKYEYEYDGNGNRTAKYTFHYNILDLNDRWGEPFKEYEWEYDEDGDIKRELYYDTDGSVRFQEEYGREYDVSGNLTKEWRVETSYYDNRDDVRVCYQEEYEYEYKYDADGHRIAYYYDTPRECGRREYEYDENGKETVCYIYSPYYGDGEVTFRLSGWGESEYDEYGNLKAYSTYYYNNEMQCVLDTVKEYEYDQDGNCIAEYWCSYSADGEPEDWSRYEYNENGDYTLMAEGYGEFYTTQRIYEYDEKGNKTAWCVYQYDGNEVSPVRSYEYEYEREYDDMGNLTQYKVFENGLLSWSDQYVYDARAGLKIAYRYNKDSSLTKTITIYGFGENAAED